MSGITPVTVLTGFLGSGKTTLLARLLRDPGFADTAVLVNEWGEAGIDHALVREARGDVVLLAGGCVCCRVAGDVVRALRELHFQRAERRIPAFSRAVIETTGLADPGPLVATLVEMPLAAVRYSLAGVATTLDAEHGVASLEAHPESVAQVAMADRLVVTKADRAGPAAVEAATRRMIEINPGAPWRLAADVDAGWLLSSGLHRGAARAPDARGWLNAGAYASFARPARHDGIASFAWRREEPASWADVESALEAVLELCGERLLRLKGLVAVEGEAGPRAVHAVRHTLYPSARLPDWPDGDRGTRIVFIARHLESAQIARILESFLPPAPP